MSAKPVKIGDMDFARKMDALAFLQSILHKYEVGDKVSKEHEIILLAALENHPDAKEKIGCGITHFSVRTADYGTKCFWVNRVDGSTEKFSHKSCV